MDIIQTITDFFFVLFLIFIAIFVVNFIKGFMTAKRAYANEKIKKNQVEIHVETIMQGDKEVFFLYEAPYSSFIFQAWSTDEIAQKLFDRYKNKTILLKKDGEEAVAYTITGQQ